MCIKDLPKELRLLYEYECRLQDNKIPDENFGVGFHNVVEGIGMRWSDSYQGASFWSKVHDGNLTQTPKPIPIINPSATDRAPERPEIHLTYKYSDIFDAMLLKPTFQMLVCIKDIPEIIKSTYKGAYLFKIGDFTWTDYYENGKACTIIESNKYGTNYPTEHFKPIDLPSQLATRKFLLGAHKSREREISNKPHDAIILECKRNLGKWKTGERVWCNRKWAGMLSFNSKAPHTLNNIVLFNQEESSDIINFKFHAGDFNVITEGILEKNKTRHYVRNDIEKPINCHELLIVTDCVVKKGSETILFKKGQSTWCNNWWTNAGIFCPNQNGQITLEHGTYLIDVKNVVLVKNTLTEPIPNITIGGGNITVKETPLVVNVETTSNVSKVEKLVELKGEVITKTKKKRILI